MDCVTQRQKTDMVLRQHSAANSSSGFLFVGLEGKNTNGSITAYRLLGSVLDLIQSGDHIRSSGTQLESSLDWVDGDPLSLLRLIIFCACQPRKSHEHVIGSLCFALFKYLMMMLISQISLGI